jgi:hypothetical protein
VLERQRKLARREAAIADLTGTPLVASREKRGIR